MKVGNKSGCHHFLILVGEHRAAALAQRGAAATSSSWQCAGSNRSCNAWCPDRRTATAIRVRRLLLKFVHCHRDSFKLGQPHLAGILEPARVGARGDAVLVVAVDGERVAQIGADRDDRALVVGEREAEVCVADRGAVIPEPGLVRPRAVDVALGDGAAIIIFGDEIVAIVEEAGEARAAGGPGEPPDRIVAEPDAARGRDQPVLDIVGVAAAAARSLTGEIFP